MNWGCNFLVGIGFPFLNEALGPWAFVPFAVVLALTFLFTYLYLPETLGRTVAEIQHLAMQTANGIPPHAPKKSKDKGKDKEKGEQFEKAAIIQSVEGVDFSPAMV